MLYLKTQQQQQQQPFYGHFSWTTRVRGYHRRNTHPPTIQIIIQSLSASSIYHDPQHPPYSNYMLLGNLFAQPLSISSLVYLLVWSPPPHIPYISSPNQCLLFTAHAHTIATCFAIVSILYHLFLVFDILALIRLLLSTPYLEFHIFYLNITHPSDHSHLCSLKCHLIFFPDRPGLTSM